MSTKKKKKIIFSEDALKKKLVVLQVSQLWTKYFTNELANVK